MSAKWRRCQACRKVLEIGDFDGDATICRADQTKASRGTSTRAATSVVTTRVIAKAAPAEPGVIAGLRGRGDTEVRSRRARVRALERLAVQFAEDFELILREERSAEGL